MRDGYLLPLWIRDQSQKLHYPPYEEEKEPQDHSQAQRWKDGRSLRVSETALKRSGKE